MGIKTFGNLGELDTYVAGMVKKVHPTDLTCIFLGGSFARGSQTALSDVDYSVSVATPFKHPIFYFELVKLEDTVRLLSVYYYEDITLLPALENVGDEEYLWVKKMMPETRFVAGSEAFYKQVCDFYKQLEYSRLPKLKTIHKSFGKLLELIARIKKWRKQKNIIEMVYYGTKLAEHVRRLVLEINGPIAVRSENVFLDGHFELPFLPFNFKQLYLQVNRYSTGTVSEEEYEKWCIDLVCETAKFLEQYKNKLDKDTVALLENPELQNYITLGV